MSHPSTNLEPSAASPDVHALKRGDIWSYAALAMPLGFVGIPLYLYAPDFYAVELGQSLSVLAVLLLVLRGIDAVQDPLIGAWSDRFAAWRLSIVVIATLAMGLGFLALFAPPLGLIGQAPWIVLAWFALCTFVATTAFSVVTINLNALGAVWSDVRKQKRRIVFTREILGLIALLLALIIPSVFQNQLGRQGSFLTFAALTALSCLLALLLFRRWYHRVRPDSAAGYSVATETSSTRWATILKPHIPFFGVFALSVLASAFPAVLFLFFVRDFLGLESSFPVFALAYFLTGILTVPLWRFLSDRFAIPNLWLLAMVLAVAAFIWAIFLEAGDFWPYLIICLATGAVFSADIVLPQTLLAYAVERQDGKAPDQSRDQSRGQSRGQAGRLFAVLAFIGKAALALATAVALFVIGTAGFQPGQENADQALFSLLIFYALLPCALKLAAAVLLLIFRQRML